MHGNAHRFCARQAPSSAPLGVLWSLRSRSRFPGSWDCDFFSFLFLGEGGGRNWGGGHVLWVGVGVIWLGWWVGGCELGWKGWIGMGLWGAGLGIGTWELGLGALCGVV